MRFRARSVAPIFAAAALLFAQLALSAFACPIGAPTAEQGAAVHAMPGCDGMDEAPSPLCRPHCAQGQQSLDRPQMSPLPPAAIIGHVTWLPLEGVAVSHASARHDARVTPPPDPPPAIRNCCLRI